MIGSLSRLGLPGNALIENRVLSVDIAATLFYWDWLQECGPSQTHTDGTDVPAHLIARFGACLIE